MSSILFLFLFQFQTHAAETGLTKEQINQISDVKLQLNKYQIEMDELLVKKSQTLNKTELDKTLDKIVKVHQELLETKKKYAQVLDEIAKEKPQLVQGIRSQDQVMAEIRRNKKNKKMGIHGESEVVDPLTKRLNDLLTLVQSKYVIFTSQKNEYVDEANLAIQSKQMRIKERDRKEYLENRAKQKFVQ